ncbi:bifunctional nicotinamidase/pyrazinamidase [Candidatus Riflebacteria bacterium]
MKALIVTDVQNDFCPEGALAVPEGHDVVPIINEIMEKFHFVVASQDWHPPGHLSFASQHEGKNPGDFIDLFGIEQLLWPDHCVQGTKGAAFFPDLHTHKFHQVFKKGVHKKVDSYSCFFENDKQTPTGLKDYFEIKGVSRVYVCGLATDYCVKYTALDAVICGFETYLIRDAARGVNLQQGDVEKAIAEMAEKGVKIITSKVL